MKFVKRLSTTTSAQATHEFQPGDDGVCQNGWVNSSGQWVKCISANPNLHIHTQAKAQTEEWSYDGYEWSVEQPVVDSW